MRRPLAAAVVCVVFFVGGCGSAEEQGSQSPPRDERPTLWQQHARLGGHAMATVGRSPEAFICTWLETPDNKGAVGCGNVSIHGCEGCMERLFEGSDAPARFAVAGLVPAGSDELRITFEDGDEAVYPVEGEVVSGPPDFRVFALPLGNRIYRRMDVLDDGHIVETAELTPREIERMNCFARFPHPAGTLVPGGELAGCLDDANE